MPRKYEDHLDGHGLNELISITSDDQDMNAGAASHVYDFLIECKDSEIRRVGRIQFQHGPRHDPGSKPGITEAALYTVLINRLRDFQAGPYACRENAIQLTKLEECLHWTKARADERARRGVLGRNAK